MSTKLDLTQGTQEWLAWRSNGVGASDSSALFDLNPYKTKRDLFFSKSGFDLEDNTGKEFIFRKGHDIEEAVRGLYLDKLGIEMTPSCYQDDILLASLDGENENEGILEVKYTDKNTVKNALKGEIKPHHKIQVQHQMLVTGYDKAHYVCSNDGKDYVNVIVEPDKELQKKIKEEVYKFWDAVLSGKCPEIGPKDTFFITDGDQRRIFQEFKELYLKKKEIEEQYKSLEAQIKEMAKHPKVKCAGVSITSYEVAGSVDYKSIEALKDVDLESYRKKPSLRKRITVGDE